MSDAALARELKQTAHQSGRIITVVAPTGAAMVERERRVQEAAARVEAVVALPAGALGLQFKRGSTIISAVGAASPVSGVLRAGDRIVAFADELSKNPARADAVDT